MALFEDISFGSPSGLLIGLGLLVAAPALVPVVGTVVRPVLKLAIWSGITAFTTAAELVATTGETLSDLVAEVRDELTPVAEALAPPEDLAPHIIRPEGASA
jgi:hypothetical protein